jgi:hypothetical protein
MRYAKGSLVLSPERDVPLLRQVRNSKFVSHAQLFEYMKLGGFDHSRNSFSWRVRRLLDAGVVNLCPNVFGAGSAVYQITKPGLAALEHQSEFATVLHSGTERLPHLSHVFHALELNAIQLALARNNLLAGWQSEIEVASYNSLSQVPFEKDYDAIVDVWMGEKTVRFALEYERTPKSQKEYRAIRAVLEAETQVGCILYLTPNEEMMIRLIQKFDSIHKRLAFANARTFTTDLLDTRIVTAQGQPGVFKGLLQ